jgi:S-DNA-T family DNA segregation ATPase FtsK/SpoIIIE
MDSALSAMPRLLAVIDRLDVLLAYGGEDARRALEHILEFGPYCGVHVLASYRPGGVSALPADLRDRFGGRLVFRQADQRGSVETLGTYGADMLAHVQDALFLDGAQGLLRVHPAEASEDDVARVVASVIIEPEAPAQAPVAAEPVRADGELDDGLYERAINIVLRDRRAYSGHLARTLSIDRTQAMALIDRMVDDGIVSAPDEGGNQRVLLERRVKVVRVS